LEEATPMFLPIQIKMKSTKTIFLFAVLAGSFASAAFDRGAFAQTRFGSGVIKGVVSDSEGTPISNAFIAIFRTGTTKILKNVRSAANGSFVSKISPGTYTVVAIADGFNPGTVSDVQINRASEFNYGFQLVRAGSGNTLPERSVERNSSKWRIRAAQASRSIYQNRESANPILEKSDPNTLAADTNENDSDQSTRGKGQSIIETFTADSGNGTFGGVNFATFQPINDSTQIVVAGQIGNSGIGMQRLETAVRTRVNNKHTLRFAGSAASIGIAKDTDEQLGQVSVQAQDEWKIREGVVLVLGFDYSRFIGAGDESSLSPRLGLQFDVNDKTRLNASLITQNDERTWTRAIEFEDNLTVFREQFAPQAIATSDGKAKIQKSRRLEFGLQRVLDNSSTVEAAAFFDTVSGRGVGLVNVPLNFLDTASIEPFIVEQVGKTQGLRVVYYRRLGKVFSATAGYSFGKGQELLSGAITNPAKIFENAVFQSFVGQVSADLPRGTQLKTVLRLSPEATVFAIDPFNGRLAIYDPGLSFLLTKSLPNFGLPIRAQAVIDARNVLDYQSGVNGEDGGLRFDSQRRILRGGIAVRF